MMKNKYKAVIFDLDGTLLDTLCDLCDSTNAALRAFGYPERTIDEVRRFVGNGIGLLIERALPSGRENPDYEKVLDAFKADYAENCLNKTKPYDGVNELILELKKRGIKTAVVSNKIDFAVKDLAGNFFPELDSALGETEGIRRKPAPDMVIRTCDFLGVKREDSLFVGDSDVDIETAKNAGTDCVSVTWGFRDRDFLLGHGAAHFADKPSDILDYLEN